MFTKRVARIALLTFSIVCLPNPQVKIFSSAHAQTMSTATIDYQLDKAERQFDNGEFERARSTLTPILNSTSSLSQSQKVKLYILKSRVEFAFEGDKALQPWIEKLYDADPNVKLDPMKDPPAAHAVLKNLKNSKRVIPQPTQNKELPIAVETSEYNVREISRYWVKLLPFGIGHFDAEQYVNGSLFLASEVSLILTAAEISKQENRTSHYCSYSYCYAEDVDTFGRDGDNFYSGVFGTFGFLGLWGHEVRHLLPTLQKINWETTEWVRYSLSFVPFGVGQLKNNEVTKAIVFGSTQTALLGISVLGPSQNSRNFFATAFFVSMLYTAYDGWANHSWQTRGPEHFTKSKFTLLSAPVFTTSKSIGIETSLNWAF